MHAGVSSRSGIAHGIAGVALGLLKLGLLERGLLRRLVGRGGALLQRTVARLVGLGPLGAAFVRAVAVGGNRLSLTRIGDSLDILHLLGRLLRGLRREATRLLLLVAYLLRNLLAQLDLLGFAVRFVREQRVRLVLESLLHLPVEALVQLLRPLLVFLREAVLRLLLEGSSQLVLVALFLVEHVPARLLIL